MEEQMEQGLSPADILPAEALPNKEEEQQLVSEIIDLANKSNAFFANENERKKDDCRVFSDVDAFNEKQKKEMGEERIPSSVNPLPLYVNAVSNLFLDNPFQADAQSEAGNSEFDKFINTQLTQILDNSDANTSVWGEALVDVTECGGAFAYLTTENGTIGLNLAYDPTSCIYDPCSKKIDGRDAEYFGIVEPVSYERAKELTNGNIPSKDRIENCKTYTFAGFKSTPDAINLLHFFRKEDGGVCFYQIVCDKVVKRSFFEGMSCLPVVPIYGQRFKDNNKKLYKGIVRDVKDLCKIVNGCYSTLWERVNQAQDPYWNLDANSIENFTEDYESNTVKYKRYRGGKFVAEGVWKDFKVPNREVPQIVTADIMPLINDSLLKISKMIGVPEDGLGFNNSGVQQTAMEVLSRSTALVNNVSHFYRHLQQSIKHMCEVIVEMLCIYNGIENTYSISVTKGPADALKRERSRQQLSALLQVTPDAAKPIITSEIVKTYDLPNAEAISRVILLTLPKELKDAIGVQNDPQAMAQQIALLTQQVAQLTQQNDELTKSQQADVIANQAQIVMARMNNEAALRSKLIELEHSSAEHEKDLALKYAELEADKQAAFADVMQKSKEADLKAREVARKELETATKLREQAEAKRAELIAQMEAEMAPAVEVAPVAVV